jgi:H+-translocating NAD(P) transhydrogenase subunit alpha
MKLAVLKEKHALEKRVAASPDAVQKYKALGFDVTVEAGAGQGASFSDEAYRAGGATIAPDAAAALAGAGLVLKVTRPDAAEIAKLPAGAALIAILSPAAARDDLPLYATQKVDALAMDLMPRITRAQSMDVLSSQSNLAGYRAVIDAAAAFGRAFPMMMTAAGTVPPARVMVMGAGVAGLQAIATARRLGAIVSATDVRPVAKEQVESLGASFVMVESEELKQAETAGGYAKEMSDDYKRRQADLIAETIKKQDIVITTALIPGRPAPRLVTDAMLRTMKPGSVIVDLAAEAGGNVEGTVTGKTVTCHGVTVLGNAHITSSIAVDASNLYARNLLNFVTLLWDKDSRTLKLDAADDIIKAVLLTRNGAVVHPSFASAAA